MSIDTRLREGLGRAMSTIETEADRLEESMRAGRRRAVTRRVVVAAGLAAMVVAAVIAAPAILDVIRGQRSRPAASPVVLPITGTYTVQITKQDAARAGAAGAEGTWLLMLSGDGQFDLASLTNGDVGRSVTQYQATGNEILTTSLDELCTDVGRYTWTRAESTISFTPVNDPCALRLAVLSSRPWGAA